MAHLGDGGRQLYALKVMTTGKGPVPDLSGAHGQVDAHNLLIFEEGLALDAHFLHSGEINLAGLTNAHTWAHRKGTVEASFIFGADVFCDQHFRE